MFNIVTHVSKLWRHPNYYIAISYLENNHNISGTGYGLSRDVAIIKSKGELIERYAANEINENKIYLGDYKSIKGKALNIKNLIQYSDEVYIKQNIYTKFTDDKKTYWVEGSTYNDEFAYLPLELVYLKNTDIKSYKEQNSNGLSYHLNEKLAFQNSFFEVIERNDFMNFWLYKKSNFQYNIESLREIKNMKILLKIIKNRGLNLKVLNISTISGLHTVLVILKNANGFVVGCSSSNEIREAIESATNEAIATYFIYEMKILKKQKINNPFDENVIDYLKGTKKSNWLFENNYLNKRFKNYKVLSVDEIIKDNNLDIYKKIIKCDHFDGIVMRVIITNAIPLTIKINNLNLPGILNTQIHPFP